MWRSRARLDPRARLLRSGRTLVAVTEKAPAARITALELRGAEVLRVAARDGRVEPRALLRVLFARGIGSVLCEGGAELAGALLDARVVDRAVIVVAPRLLGGRGARPSVLGRGRSLRAAIPLADVAVARRGADIVITGRVRGAR